MVKISDLIAEFLEKLEIKTVFGIIGSANSHVFDSISKKGYTKIVCVHHEQAAVLAAGAYFRSSGKLSAALVTAGAGSSNAITGVLSNWADSIPCLIISGQEKTQYLEKHKDLRMFGIQGFNAPSSVSKITKYSKTLTNPSSVQKELENAYKTCLSGRPGPVWLDFPFDIQSSQAERSEWNLDLPNPLAFEASPVIIKMDIDYVVECFSKSKRPVIWGGHGIRLSGAKNQFRKLVEKLEVPVLLTWSAIDLLEENHPWLFGRAGISGQRRGNFIIQNSDFILVIGSRLSLLQTGYDISKFAPQAKIVLVDVDRGEWHKYYDIYDRFIQLDAKYFISELINQPGSFYRKEWVDYCNKMKKNFDPENEGYEDTEGYINSYNFVSEVCECMNDDQIIVTDMGTGLLSGHHSMKLGINNLMFTSLGLGEMGYGLPGAIGASFAFPQRQILCLNCDGGMMMNLQELQTIIHHNLPIKIVVFENDGYLMIKHTQKLLFNGNYNNVNKDTGVSLPDFVKLGQSLGFESYYVGGDEKKYGSLRPILKSFFGDMNPSICVVKMDPEQDFYPKVKGILQKDGSIFSPPLEEMSPLLSYERIKECMPWALSELSEKINRS